MAITLTQSAADRVGDYLVHRGRGIGLRVGIKRTGCNGFAYVVDYADRVDVGDQVFDTGGVNVVVDQASLDVIDGTEVDFVKDGLSEMFKFRNPKATGECGCGERFRVSSRVAAPKEDESTRHGLVCLRCLIRILQVKLRVYARPALLPGAFNPIQ